MQDAIVYMSPTDLSLDASHALPLVPAPCPVNQNETSSPLKAFWSSPPVTVVDLPSKTLVDDDGVPPRSRRVARVVFPTPGGP